MKLFSCSLFFIFFLSCSLQSQSWNGIGYNVPTYRNGVVVIGTDVIPESRDVAYQDISNYKLFVCGGILADEWLVPNTTWCDYVFYPDYDLMPLEKVAQHIEEKGHLHKTPSAKEVEEKGLKMKDITINQQEKIEEIYLHLIEMNERLKAVEAENIKLKAQNEKLAAIVESQK